MIRKHTLAIGTMPNKSFGYLFDLSPRSKRMFVEIADRKTWKPLRRKPQLKFRSSLFKGLQG